MKILNNSVYELTINGEPVAPGGEYITGEMMFNSQAIFSNIGSVEILTEYGERTFRCYGNLKAYNDKKHRDANGMPQIIVVNTIPQNLYKDAE